MEYKVIEGRFIKASTVTEKINKFAKQGYKLHSLQKFSETYVLVFERTVQNENKE